MTVLDQIVFIHLSDVHIGRKLMNDEFQTGIKSGYNPHDHRLLLPLQNAIKDACRRLRANQPVYLLISGDLTTSGTDNDYGIAFALIHNQWIWKRMPERKIGFGWLPERTLTVPGNHDHWRQDKRPHAFSHELSPAWFESTPWMRPVVGTNNRLVLELFGVDSNSGLKGRPFNLNVFAEGSISDDEFNELERQLQDSVEQIRIEGQVAVRAIVCHHAFSGRSGLFSAKVLDDPSRSRLIKLALDYRAGVILTGHVHTFHEEDWPREEKTTQKLKELRCATSLQGPASAGVQGFWVHSIALRRLNESPVSCVWTAVKYQWGGSYFDADLTGAVTISLPIE